MSITIIGDVHGKINQYLDSTKQHKHTLQLGEQGFYYEHLNNIDPQHHKVLAGNHDNFDELSKKPHCIQNHTLHFNGFDIFCVRGASSIDKKYRTFGIDWFQNEELTYVEMQECISQYIKIAPSIVCSHTVCESVAKQLITGKRYTCTTAIMLEQLFQIHQPKLWIFGHFHKSFRRKINNTLFIGLNELEIYLLKKEN